MCGERLLLVAEDGGPTAPLLLQRAAHVLVAVPDPSACCRQALDRTLMPPAQPHEFHFLRGLIPDCVPSHEVHSGSLQLAPVAGSPYGFAEHSVGLADTRSGGRRTLPRRSTSSLSTRTFQRPSFCSRVQPKASATFEVVNLRASASARSTSECHEPRRADGAT